MSSKIAPLCNITSDLHRARILIVEDDPVMRLGLEQFLEDYPEFQVVGIAVDGYMGVEAANQDTTQLASEIEYMGDRGGHRQRFFQGIV